MQEIHPVTAPTEAGHPPLQEAYSLWLNPLVPELRPESALTAPPEALKRYQDVLAAQAAGLPEVAEAQETQTGILEAGREIINRYEIQASLFDDEARSLIFTAVANRWVIARSNRSRNPQKARDEEAFLLDVLTLLAYEHSPVLAAAKPQIEKAATLDETRKTAIYEKYTNHQLSREISQAISSGLLDSVKARMGVTATDESAYEVRVLSIDPNGRGSHGLAPKVIKWEDLPGTHEQKRVALEEQRERREAARQHSEYLARHADEMFAELGEQAPVTALAWVTTLADGSRPVLCIMEPHAVKLLHPELTTAHNTNLDEAAAAYDQAVLEHEYVHTQQMLSLDSKPLIGINLEELRAEHFSGNKIAYAEVKAFFNDVKIITGFDMVDVLGRRPKGGRNAEVYTDMAAAIGLDGMLEVLLAAPKSYIEDIENNSFQHSIFRYIDGYDGVSSQLVARELARDDGAAMRARLTKVAAAFENPSKYYGWINRRAFMGIHKVAVLVGQHYRELQDKAA